MWTTMCLTCRAALIAEWLRGRLTPSRDSGRSGGWTVERRRCREREAHSHQIHMVQDHSRIMSLGAGVLAGWWQNVGDQLDTGPQTSAIVCCRGAMAGASVVHRLIATPTRQSAMRRGQITRD